jgi:hypothetical protein
MRLPRLRAETTIVTRNCDEALRRAGTHLLGARKDRLGKRFCFLNENLCDHKISEWPSHAFEHLLGKKKDTVDYQFKL